ncbi:MAG TPA: HAMP domain-containing sensor histidine kinase [Candidatus Dormibacteraeota bacterium]|nr:HAMP domain-containing sensor histidine kinase [Candidatus Dormibacteraeota bacterium]
MSSLASRLTAWYVALLGLLLLVVLAVSSLLLVFTLDGIGRDVLVAKHVQARELVERYERQGINLPSAAPQLAANLGGIGLRVGIFDDAGHLLSGDPSLAEMGPRVAAEPRSTPGPNDGDRRDYRRHGPPVVRVTGGFIVFAPSLALIWVTLMPYWRTMLIVVAVALVAAWLLGRYLAQQALRPLNDVSSALGRLAAGDYSRRTFAMSESSEIGALAAAYNTAAERVAVAMEERVRTETRMRQFVADAGHELRTPLTVIAGYIDVLRRGAMAEPAVAGQILETMGEEGVRMRTLIERLLRLARLDGDTPPQASTFDLAQTASEVAESTSGLAPQTEIRYAGGGPAVVNADEGELREALRAVIDNALKYAPHSPVEISVAREGGHAVVRVADHGPGMTADERAHAFERFFRGDSRGDVVGAGLGLAIAKRAIERAGGSIALEGAPGLGTTVVFRVPLATTS